MSNSGSRKVARGDCAFILIAALCGNYGPLYLMLAFCNLSYSVFLEGTITVVVIYSGLFFLSFCSYAAIYPLNLIENS